MEKPFILCLCETHITDKITPSEIKLDGYKFEQCCSFNSRTGGAVIFIKDIKSFENCVWMVAIEIQISSVMSWQMN
jgi:hypothetical protein